ncbi:MAG: glycosyltransferase [Deltaproteobacteria bacterium]|nr:glycosyltransferase [Deltaproteobacteria bacterium]
MRRTKILYFIPNLQQGGPERQILEMIRNLPERFEPILCVYNDEGIFFDDRLLPGQPRHSLGVKRMGISALRKLTEILKAEQPDIVHSYRDKANFWMRLAARRAGVRVLITSCRNRMMQLRYLLIEKWMSRGTQVILTNSEGVKYELTRYARVPAAKIRVIHNILDVNFFRPPTPGEKAEARVRWNVSDGDLVLLLPGRVGVQKHQIGLLRALRSLAKQRRLPSNIVLLLAGRNRDPIASRWVASLAQSPELKPHVRLLGAQKDMRSLYWASDVLVMPSLYEGLANAALEGCACGLPAVLSHAANVDGIVEPGTSGWEVPTFKQAPLVEALADVFTMPRVDLISRGAAAAQHMRARFAPTPLHVVDQTVAIYDELLRRHGRREEHDLL